MSEYMPCAECGRTLPGSASFAHVCDPAHRVEYQMLALADGIRSFEFDLRRYLDGNQGRFLRWLAARDVRRTTGS